MIPLAPSITTAPCLNPAYYATSRSTLISDACRRSVVCVINKAILRDSALRFGWDEVMLW
jgi:hypothetical protein